jgi:SagB-type dehydrogenase family enzyme
MTAKSTGIIIVCAATLLITAGSPATGELRGLAVTATTGIIKLPDPTHRSDTSLEETLVARRSVRRYARQPITLDQASQLLWAAQGVTHPQGYRTAPSAGALYPLEVYLVAGQVEGLDPGIYKYRPRGHDLVKVVEGDRRKELKDASLRQRSIEFAPATIAFTAVYPRMMVKYSQRGIRYVDMEAGHAAQNACLQAVSLGLGALTIGAFREDDVRRVLGCGADEEPIYLITVGVAG